MQTSPKFNENGHCAAAAAPGARPLPIALLNVVLLVVVARHRAATCNSQRLTFASRIPAVHCAPLPPRLPPPRGPHGRWLRLAHKHPPPGFHGEDHAATTTNEHSGNPSRRQSSSVEAPRPQSSSSSSSVAVVIITIVGCGAELDFIVIALINANRHIIGKSS